MLPVEVELEVLVHVPVEPEVGHVDPVGPEVRVGQAVGEDLVADVQVVVPAGQLPGTQAELALAQVERVGGLTMPTLLRVSPVSR